MFVIDGKVITPATDGSILKGITRDTILKILEYKGIPHEERKVSIDELVADYHNGTLQEAFGVGTAAVVIGVEDITYRDLVMKMPPMNIGKMLKEEIENIRTGKIEDKMGWLVPVQAVPANA
jgi:branched-chain amino acid aminotransferase